MVRFLLRTGMRRGVLGGSRVWTTVAGLIFGVRMLKKLTGSEPELVHTATLRPGETLVVSHGTPDKPAPESIRATPRRRR
ncbi:MAG TPA: hypothetical protein VMZ51_09245 [Acidimicrobiales bacterium]|nr:hypothetical protein [Acidimicrobiales bacterium]